MQHGLADFSLSWRLLLEQFAFSGRVLLRVEQCVNLIELSELLLYFLLDKLVRVVLHISQEHVSEENSGLFRRMPLHEHVQISKARIAVAHSSVGVCDVERANELGVIDQLHFLVVPLEKLGGVATQEVHSPVSEGVISDTHAASCLELGHECLVGVKVQIVDD